MATRSRPVVPWLERLEGRVLLSASGVSPGLVVPAVSSLADDANNTLGVTDPDLLKEGNTYYVFSSGPGIEIRSSTDLMQWKVDGSVFPQGVPAWARAAVPGATSIWAPDVAFFAGQYHLYYAVSTYGSQRSVIGLATNTTLNPTDPAYRWVDQGLVVASRPGRDRFNAIDPNVAVDGSGNVWLTFGSRWGGIQQLRIDPSTGRIQAAPAPRARASVRYTRTLAARPDGQTIEAPFLFERGGLDYLFVSVGNCCMGASSTYRVMVGRSSSPNGPFVDRSCQPLTRGGGTLVVSRSRRWTGPGSASVLGDGPVDWIVFQADDARNAGQPTLELSPLTWTPDGWPVVVRPIG